MRLSRPSFVLPVALRAFLLAAVALSACAPHLRLEDAGPRPVAPGARLTVTGDGFLDGLELSLEGAGIEVRLQQLEIEGVDAASAKVPGATPAGTYELVARRDGLTARLPGIRVVAGGVRVHFLDVGQGDATLVVAPGGETLLVDGGPRDAGSVVKRALSELAGGRLDAVVLSHTDADHLGGLVETLAGPDGVAGTGDDIVPAQRLSYVDDGSCESQLCAEARALGAWPFQAAAPGAPVALGDADITVVAADGDVGGGKLPGTEADNERSVVVRIAFAGHSVLVTGDLTGGGAGDADVEGPLAARTGPVDVLRVSHHGSNTSSNAAALAAWQPRALVLSVGTDNAFCHPADDAFSRLVGTGAPLYATGGGVVDDVVRCGAPTAWPSSARPGLGTITLEMGVDGGLTLQGDPL